MIIVYACLLVLTCCAIKISNRNIKVAEYVKRFSSKSRITEDDATKELVLIKAPSRNRAVYRLRVPFLGTFLGKQKGTKPIFYKNSLCYRVFQ